MMMGRDFALDRIGAGMEESFHGTGGDADDRAW
jgi:hypothetical protein